VSHENDTARLSTTDKTLAEPLPIWVTWRVPKVIGEPGLA